MRISPSPKACGNSTRRKSSSSATLIFAAAMPSPPSLRAFSYITLCASPKWNLLMAAQAARAPVEEAPLLLREAKGPIAVVTFNRPAQRNTLSAEVIAALHAALDEIATDKTVRALVIASQGPAFSSGHDLKQLTAHRSDADGGRAYFAKIMNACSAMMQAIVNLPKPVIAAVEGVATAAGCQLVATCDLAIAGEKACFALPGVGIGLFCSTPLVALGRAISRKHAMEMALTGELYSARDAERF